MNNPSDQENKTSIDGKEKDDKVNNNSNSNDINKEKEEIKEHLLKILYLAINSDDVNPNMKDSVFKVVSSELCKLNESSSSTNNNNINSDNNNKSLSRTIEAPSNNYQELNNNNALSYPNNNLNNSSSSNTNVNLNLSSLSFIVPPNVYNSTGLINDPNIYLQNIHNQNNPINHINPRNIGIDNFDRLLVNHNNPNYSGINNNINNINYLNNSNFHGYNQYPNILSLLNLGNPNNINNMNSLNNLNIYNPYNYMSNSNYNNINNILLNLTGNKDNDSNNAMIKKEIEKLGFSNNIDSINNLNNISSNNGFCNRNICNEFIDEAKYLNQYKASNDLYNIMSLYNNDQNNDNDIKDNNNAFEKWLIENPNYFYNINNTNNLSQFDNNNKSIGGNSNNNFVNSNQQSFYSDLLFRVNNSNNSNFTNTNNNTTSSNKQNDLLEYYSNNLQNNINNSIKFSSNNNVCKVPNKTGLSNTNNSTDTYNYGNNQFQEQLYNYLNFKTQFPVKSESNYDNMNNTNNRNESCFDKNLIESMYNSQINSGNKAQLNKGNNNSNSNNNINNLNNINNKKLIQQKSAKYLLDKMTNNNFSDVVNSQSINKNNSKQDIMKNHTNNANNSKNNGEQDTSIFKNNNTINNNNNTVNNKKDTSTSKTKQVAIKETFNADRPELSPLETRIPNNELNYILEIFEFLANYDLVDNKKIKNQEEFYSDFIINSKDYFKKVVVYFLTNLTYFNSKNNAYTASINKKISEKIRIKDKNLSKQYDFFVHIGSQFAKSIITNEKLITNLIFFFIKMSMSSSYCSGNCILEREDLADIIEVIYSEETELFDTILLESFSIKDNKDNKSNLTTTFKTKLMHVLMYVLMELPGFKLLINEKQGTFNQEKEKYQLENEIANINKKLNSTKAKISDIQTILKNSNNSNNNTITTTNNTIVFNQMKLSNLEKEEEEFTKNFDLLIKRYNKTFTSNTRRVLLGKDYLKNVYYLPHNFLSEEIVLIKRNKNSDDKDFKENEEWRILRFENISSFSSKLSNTINSEVNLNKKLEIIKIIVEYKKQKKEEKNKSSFNINENKETKHDENDVNDKKKENKESILEKVNKDVIKEINLTAASILNPNVATDIDSANKNEIITIIESNIDNMIKNIKDSEKTISEYLENFDKLWVRHEIKDKIFSLLDSNTRLFKQQVLNTIKNIINNDSNNNSINNSITSIKHFLSNSKCCLDYVIFINNLLLLLFSRFNKPFKLITENNDDSEDDDDKKKKDSKKNRENKEKDNKDSKDNSDDSSNIEYNNQDNLIIKLSDDLMINMFEPRIYSNFIRLWPRDLEELNCNKNLIKMLKKNYLNNVDYTLINRSSDENKENKNRTNDNLASLIKLTEDSETVDINDINEITSSHTIDKTTKVIESNNTINFDFLLFTSFTLKYLIDNLLLRWESKGKMYLKKKPKIEEVKEEEEESSSSTSNNDDEDFKANSKSKSKINKNKDGEKQEEDISESDSETNSDDNNSFEENNSSNNDDEAKEEKEKKEKNDDNDSNNRRLTRNQRLLKKKEKKEKEEKKEEKNKTDQNQPQREFLKNKRKKSTVTSNNTNNKNIESNENNNTSLNLVEDVYKKTRSGRRARVGKSDKNKICYICNENEIDLICDICGIGSHLSCSKLKKTPSTWYCNVCSA